MKLVWRPGAAAERGWRAGLVAKTALTGIAAAAALLAVPAMAYAAPAKAAAKHPSTVSVSASPRVAVAGTGVKLTATVKSANPAPTGSVTFWWGSKRLCSGNLSHGSAHCNAKFTTAGDFAVRGVYSGDAKHAGATGKVTVVATKAATIARITSVIPADPPPGFPADVPAGTPATVTVTVTNRAGALAPTGKVSVNPTDTSDVQKGYSCTFILTASSHGKGTCQIKPPPPTFGTIMYVATYRGDGAHTGSASAQFKVIVPDVTVTTVSFSGAMGALTATVTNQKLNNISPSAGGTGTVTFTTGGATICSDVKLSYTAATGNTATCSYTPTGGSATVTATYSGDEHNLGSSGTTTVG
jgi:hypothetical protein